MKTTSGKILVVDDDQHILLTTRVILKNVFKQISCLSSPMELEKTLEKESFDVVLLDMNFSAGVTSGSEGIRWLSRVLEQGPETQVVMMTAYGDINLAVQAMKKGASDFIIKPWDNEKLVATVKAAYRLSQSRKEVNDLKTRGRQFNRALNASQDYLLGNSEAMKHIFSSIEKVATTDANVLLLGENGTGKELVARAIHSKSKRSEEAFIHVDLGAIAEGLFESEMFGHEKGAFTDAKDQRIGRFELAHGGTLFLDEIGNLSLPVQVKLLSALQNRRLTRVGGQESIPVDIRLISATNSPVKQLIETGQFREDLLFRINTIEIVIPPLRERDDDVFLLADFFLDLYSKKYHKSKLSFGKSVKRQLQKYDWPGNVRELRHVIERAVIMSETSIIEPMDLMLQNRQMMPSPGSDVLNLEQIEKQTILTALRKHHGNLSKAAKELGLGRTTLYRKMNKYEL